LLQFKLAPHHCGQHITASVSGQFIPSSAIGSGPLPTKFMFHVAKNGILARLKISMTTGWNEDPGTAYSAMNICSAYKSTMRLRRGKLVDLTATLAVTLGLSTDLAVIVALPSPIAHACPLLPTCTALVLFDDHVTFWLAFDGVAAAVSCTMPFT
jgi:hypothetical protein